VRSFLLAAAVAMLLSTCPALAQADNIAGEDEPHKDDDKKDGGENPECPIALLLLRGDS
jgi:hypothetical protein